jgi:hypothetical protein
MTMHLPRRLAAAVLTLGTLAGAAVVAAAPAEAATATSTSADSGPAPICWSQPVICVPQTWYVATNVITNDGLDQLLPTASEANTTATATQMSQTVTVTGQLTASLSGQIPVNPATILGAVSTLTLGGQAQVSGSDAQQGTVQVPAGDIGYLEFGIIYIQTNGIAYFRNINGQVTSEPEVATVPVGFGYIASVAPIQSGSASSAAGNRTVVVTSR